MNSIVAEKQYIAAKLGLPYENLSQSELRSETLLTSTSVINFALQKNKKSTPNVTEKLLELNDKFVVTHFTVKLKQVVGVATTESLQGLAALYTYENEYVFGQIVNGTAVAKPLFTGTASSNVAAIYNGQLSMTIDRRVFIPAFPVLAFRRTGATQQGAFLRTAGTVATAAATFNGNTGLDEVSNGLFAYYNSEPTLIDGRQTIDTAINLPTSYTFSGDTVTSGGAAVNNYAVFCARGYLVVNAE
jgi:hypothetical protein